MNCESIKIVTVEQAIQIAQDLHMKNKRIVLVGGCFDILHIGHIAFLERAKKAGDVLFILLEADESIRQIKGESRPINNQENRARILAAIEVVDEVILLSHRLKNQDYDKLIMQLKPAIIAITRGDLKRHQKARQASLVNAEIIDVIDVISDQSTTRLVRLLDKDL
jgi:rfaE bifunctional protein nucleotidyltransferase chain/domain